MLFSYLRSFYFGGDVAHYIHYQSARANTRTKVGQRVLPYKPLTKKYE